jgi:hypothetical protein
MLPSGRPWLGLRRPAVCLTARPHAPGVTRTRGQQFRKLLLYPSELRGPTRSNIEEWQAHLIRFLSVPWGATDG